MKVGNIETLLHAHRGKPACLLGNGPSLLDWDLEELRGNHVLIGVNKSWTQVQARYHCAIAWEHLQDLCDGKYSPGGWDGETFEHGMLFMREAMFSPRARTAMKNWAGTVVPIRQPQRNGDQVWFSADMSLGLHSSFGGQMAIELALWMGCSPIYLLGYDAHNVEGHHWSPSGANTSANRCKQVEYLKPVAAYAERVGATVYNANEESAIPHFQFRKPEVVAADAAV